MLKEIAQHHEIPIVVTNQITTHFERGGKRQEMDENDERKDEPGKEDDDGEEEETHGEEPRGVVTAALGNSWSHFVNTRIALDFDTDDRERRKNVGLGREKLA